MNENPENQPNSLQPLLSELGRLHGKSLELLRALRELNAQLAIQRAQAKEEDETDADGIDTIFTEADREFLAKINAACG
jgi:hypothetical protein